MNLIPQEPEVERIERFVSLQAGRYWKALEAIPEEAIEQGEVLLLESIRWVENQAHTIIMRAHPSKFDRRLEVNYMDESGEMRTKYITPKKHRFLVKDFLGLFVFEPDHQQIRTKELLEVQGRINNLQHELLQAQSDPRVLAAVVAEELSKDDNKTSDGQTTLPALTTGSDQVAETITSSSIADIIGMGVTVDSINMMKETANQHHRVATIKSQWIQRKTAEIARTVGAMTPFYEEQAAAALSQTEDVREHVSKLLEGIASLDLYVGKDVEVINISQGASAPVTEPLTFVQKKLVMEEELAVWADINEWFDFRDHELFFNALRQHPDLVNQIFPTPRCMLVMTTRRRDIDYGDTFINHRNNKMNALVFIMVRDGENIYQVYSPVESHLGSSKLFPSKDDQEKIFRGIDGSQIKFEDVAYTDRLAHHDRFALHYKRLLLLACGLDHRLKLFGEFYEGEPSFKFVSMQFQEDHCRFLHDEDGTDLLPKESRQSLRDWIKEKNAYLSSGSRVLCHWEMLMSPATAPSACKEARFGSRGSFERVYTPDEPNDICIAYRAADQLCVDVQVRGYSYSKHEDRTFTCRVKLLDRDNWGAVSMPFLCLDAVTPEELHWYIHNRDSRINHLLYIRLFKTALQHIETELKQEIPTRQFMAEALVAGKIGHPAEHPDIINQTVRAWRAANRGKPLPDMDTATARVRNSLLDQMFMLAGEGANRVEEVERHVLEQGLMPLRLVLTGMAKMVVYAAANERDQDDRMTPHVWVHRIVMEKGKRKLLEKSRSWEILPTASASETVIHEWDQASKWMGLASIFTSYGQKKELLDLPCEFEMRLDRYTHPFSHTEFELQLELWNAMFSDMKQQAPTLLIPFGVGIFSGELHYLCVGTMNSVGLLYQLAPDEDAKERVRRSYVNVFESKLHAQQRFENMIREVKWSLLVTPVTMLNHRSCDWVNGETIDISRLSNRQPANPLLNNWFEQWSHRDKTVTHWLYAPTVDFDTPLGISMPQDYDPVHVCQVSITNGTKSQFNKWFDIVPGEVATEHEVETLVKGHEDHKSYSVRTEAFMSLALARCSLAERMKDGAQKGFMLKLSTHLPEAPQPPEGIERWYSLEIEV